MRVILHGVLKDRVGATFEIEAASIADAIEGLSRQTDWPSDIPVRVVGYDKNAKELYTACPDEIHLMPALRGGSGRFFNIVIGAALVVTGILVGGFSNPLGASLIVSGSMMALQGVVGLFQKQPEFNRNEDPEASKYLNPNRNTVQAGTPVTLAYGEIDLAGHWLSIQSNSSNLSYGSFPASAQPPAATDIVIFDASHQHVADQASATTGGSVAVHSSNHGHSSASPSLSASNTFFMAVSWLELETP